MLCGKCGTKMKFIQEFGENYKCKNCGRIIKAWFSTSRTQTFYNKEDFFAKKCVKK